MDNILNEKNFKKGTGKYYQSYKNKSGKSVPAKFSLKEKLSQEVNEIFENAEEVIIFVDKENRRVWIQKL